MKISFLSFLLIVLLSSCGGEDVQKEGKSSNGSDSSESENIEALAAEAVDFEKSLELKRVDGVKLVHDSTTQKLFTGWAKATRENGQLVDLVHVKNGSALTIYKFYENGKKHFKIENSKDRKIKSAISWKPNGEKCPETNVNNGNGVFVRYFETGRKESEQNFKDYEKDGVCTDWYENGNKSKEVSYKNGKLDGFEIFYHEDGTEEIRFIYKDGEQIGRYKEDESSVAPVSSNQASSPPKPIDNKKEILLDSRTYLIGDLDYRLLWCNPGSFKMGSPADEIDRNDNETLHEVTLSKGFWLGEYTISQSQWSELMDEPVKVRFEGKDLPVDSVNWYQALAYCKKLNEIEISDPSSILFKKSFN